MEHFEGLRKHVRDKVSLTEEELDLFCSHFTVTRVKRRQFIVQPGFTARSRYYVVEGALKGYVIGDEGQEHTIQLAVEDWWISDYNSYIYQKPATMFVMALEDGILLEITFAKEQELKNLHPLFETYFRIIAEKSTASLQRRLIINLTKSAEERYDYLQETYPQFATRIPQNALASFLGMSNEYFSKLRNRRIPRKS